jgi:iron complex outermembrane receptor protein
MSVPGSRLSFGASYGSFGTQKIDAGGGWSSGSAAILASGSYYYTGGHRPYSEFRIRNGSVRASVNIDEHFTFTPDLRLSAFRTFDPGPGSTQTIDHWVDIVRGSSGFSLENAHGNMKGALKMFYNFGIHDIYDGFHSGDNNIGALLYQGFQPFAGNVTTAGIDIKRYGGKANNTVSGFDFGNHLITEYGGYVLVQQSFPGLATVTAGLRINHHSLYGNELAPQAGIAVPYSTGGTVRFSAGKGFRSPTIRELYLFPAPTPSLEPERVWSTEAGVRQEIGTTASFEATGYINEGSNIIRAGGAFPNLTLSNSGRFIHRGVELEASFRPSSWIDLDLTYGYLDAGDQTNANPKHKIFAGGMVKISPVTVSAGMQYVARLFGDDFSRKALGDYALLNARATMQFPEGLSAYVAGENLLDRSYQIIYDYPMPGATFFAGLRWTMENGNAGISQQP